jgi:alkylation response protein AidB-like acyl-CoA dehydrogenase|tara:strand:+ start:1248 stop:2414 length:1167 start_codon:yes stop_codon:yes gene_type:complete
MAKETVLSDDLLQRCAARAAGYDRDNKFFTEDFEELKAAGYLSGPVPTEFGGGGLSLAESCAEQRRLAYHAPATALAINMHIYWAGIAADLWRSGDKSLEWLLEESATGEVFAAGHSERGNDLPVFLSTATAKKVDGGYRFSGHKMFSSLSPVWTRFGFHAMDADAEGGPRIVHAFMPRNTAGYTIKETWDTLGMRATRSDDTLIEDAFVADKYVARTVPAGQGDPFVLTLFAWALLGFASVYCGIAQRAVDLAVPSTKKKTSLAVSRSMAYHPEVQHTVAQMVLANESILPYLEKTCADWTNGVDHGAVWPSKIVATKYHAVETCWKVVDLAMDVSGGSGMFRGMELERLFRDARCGRFHPATSNLTHEIVAKTALGIDLGEQPRWG